MFYNKMVPDGTYCLTGYKGNDAHVDIPTNITVTVLNDFLFKNHTEITSVTIPDTVLEIGGFIFDGCTGLKSVEIPSSVVSMWQYAFTRTSLEEVEIPGSIKRIIPFTFFDSRDLKVVRFNEGTEKVLAWAFKDCVSLTDVYLPESLIDISDKAFEGCGEITFHRF